MKKNFILSLFFLSLLFCQIKAQDTPFPLNKLNFGNHNIGLNAYMRTGFGLSKFDTTQAYFMAPGANYKYRLGNESDHYTEYQFFYEYLLDKSSNKSFEVAYMGAFQKLYGDTNPFVNMMIPGLYAKLNNIYKNMSLWLGKRYYERQQHNITDHFWLNPGNGAVGFGIEGILGDSGFGSNDQDLKFVLFKYKNDLGKEEDKKALNTYALDARWVRIDLNKNGKLNLWGTYSIRPSVGNTSFALKNGFGLGLWHNQQLLGEKIKNTLVALYKKGASMKEVGAIKELSTDNSFIEYDLDKAYSLFIANHALIEFPKICSLEGIISYKIQNNGLNPHNENAQKALGDRIHWFSTGARYLHYLHKHFNLAFEVGLDYVNNKVDLNAKHIKGWLSKFTLAPQISWDYGYWSRPVIRPFVTYAFWDKSMKGLVGNMPGSAPYKNTTNGFSCGIQMEIWF